LPLTISCDSICYNTAVCALVGDLKIPLPFLPNTSTTGNVPKSVLILGGSSACGTAAIQLLRLAYPSLPILATSSPKHHEHVAALGATQLFDYHSPSHVSDIKVASPEARGVDMILDCVGAGAVQTNICDVLDPAGPKTYAAVIVGTPVPVPEGVTKFDSHGWAISELEGGETVIPALTKLVEEGKYKLPLPVRVVGHGLDQVSAVTDQTKTVSGEKLVVTI
jgi:NADPH:quinone reductase-like Zn-dependent oxidoreductase